MTTQENNPQEAREGGENKPSDEQVANAVRAFINAGKRGRDMFGAMQAALTEVAVTSAPAPTDTGVAGAGEVKPWQERTSQYETEIFSQVERMEAEIADLRAQLARQRKGCESMPKYQVWQVEPASCWCDVSKAEFDAAGGTKRIVYTTPPSAQQEPVAYVPIHPRLGPLWPNTVPTLQCDRPAHYPTKPLYFAAQQEQGDAVRDSDLLDFLDTNNRFRMGWKVGMAPVGNLSVQSIINGGLPIREAIKAAIALRATNTGKEQQ